MTKNRVLTTGAAVVLVAAALAAWAAADNGATKIDPREAASRPAKDEGVYRPRPRGGDVPPPPPPAQLSSEQEKELLGALEKKKPSVYQRLIQLRDSRPTLYQSALRAAWWSYQKWKNMPEPVQDAVLTEQELRAELGRVAEGIRKATDKAQRDKLVEQARATMTKLFEAEQKIREYRLSQLEEQIKKLREEMEKRYQQRNEIIEERINRWLKEGQGPAGAPAHAPATSQPTK